MAPSDLSNPDRAAADPALSPIATTEIAVGGVGMALGADGALWIPDCRALVVSDLHLEKATSYARHGRFLPPYDTAATLARLEAAVARRQPATVIALGDSFHDADAPDRIGAEPTARLKRLTQAVDHWIWITGNHDPDIDSAGVAAFGGEVRSEVTLAGLTFRHEPAGDTGDGKAAGAGEVAGHLHPKTVIHTRLARFSGPCFVHDRRRLIMPAFGAFTGGLDIGHPAIRGLFGCGGHAHALIRGRLITRPLSRKA